MKRHLRMWLMAILFLPLYSLGQNAVSTINSVLHGKVTDSKKGIPLEGGTAFMLYRYFSPSLSADETCYFA